MSLQRIDWMAEALARKEELLEQLCQLLSIPSVRNMETATAEEPYGRACAEALDYILGIMHAEGIRVHNIQGKIGYGELAVNAGHAEYVAALCHLDVVPATGSWASPPFQPSIRDGRLYARGAIDDKGPAMAVLYALKIIKELKLPLKRSIRVIYGLNEESGMYCMDAYNEAELPPVAGFSPDAEFPIVNAEKGQVNGRLVRFHDRLAKDEPVDESMNRLEDKAKDEPKEESQEGMKEGPKDGMKDEPMAAESGQGEEGLSLLSFHAGTAANMVPDYAAAAISGEAPELEKLSLSFHTFLQEHGLEGKAEFDVEHVCVMLELYGRSAHGMVPEAGINAGMKLAQFLLAARLDESAWRFICCAVRLFGDDCAGEKIGIAASDDVTGHLTINIGLMDYECASGIVSMHVNLRYPLVQNGESIIQAIAEQAGAYGFSFIDTVIKTPHHIPSDHPLVRTLQRVYAEETGEEPRLLSTGGGTYACKLACGVAFGALFPGREGTAHQPDEYIEVDDLVKSVAIYARAMYELANMEV